MVKLCGGGGDSGLIVGLGGGLITALRDGLLFGATIEPVETMHWSWQRVLRHGARILGGVLIVGLIVGLILGLLLAPISVISYGLVPGKIEQRLVPNQAIWASLRNGLICVAIALVGGLVGGSLVGLLIWLLSARGQDVLIVGLIGGLGGGLNRGGGAFIRHFMLRTQLAFEGFAPFRYVPFLEYATTLLFLERNGGAYRFRHDLLREYFAALIPTRDGASN